MPGVIPYLSGKVESAPFRFKNSAKYKGVPSKSFWAFKSAPNFKNNVNVIRGLDQQLREKNVTVTTTYGSFQLPIALLPFLFHFLKVFFQAESCRTVFGIKSLSTLCYAMQGFRALTPCNPGTVATRKKINL
jgi:hypothetical protein